MAYDKIKDKWEKKKEALNDEAIIFIYKEIEKLCAKNKWTFKTVYGCTILDEEENEIYDTELHKLVFWYEDYFCGFPFIVNINGEWIEGQTPLIQFSKPEYAH
jgi:hypothetical protein